MWDHLLGQDQVNMVPDNCVLRTEEITELNEFVNLSGCGLKRPSESFSDFKIMRKINI